MTTPFIYGKIADKDNFTNRIVETEYLENNFSSLINTTIISPRRWGKTSLVNKVIQQTKEKHTDYIFCQIDLFNIRSEKEFYIAFAKAILNASYSKWEEIAETAKKYLSRMIPKISLSGGENSYDLTFGIDWDMQDYSFDEVLDLPQTLASAKQKKMVICIDEFQNINTYSDPLAFQKKLRAHWELQTDVCYCLYGSKRHMLQTLFSNSNMPFYKFGDILFLQKISREDWIKFITTRFEQTNKHISVNLAGKIADLMENHSYYTQQLSQQVWLRTEKICTEQILTSAFKSLINQLSLLFTSIIDMLPLRQINFLQAILEGEKNFSSKNVLKKYDLGTSANIKNLKNSLLEKDIIDITSKNEVLIQDPVFKYWLKDEYFHL